MTALAYVAQEKWKKTHVIITAYRDRSLDEVRLGACAAGQYRRLDLHPGVAREDRGQFNWARRRHVE
jgi:hypothetical protein